MQFTELESIMSKRGITTLAHIARALDTTPQAVSNWKARDQIPYHIIAKLNKNIDQQHSVQAPNYLVPNVFEEKTLNLSDILLTIAEQLKVVMMTTFVFVFFTFTYVQFIQTPKYVSWASVLLPPKNSGNLGGLAGLASQFGVRVPTGTQADLSSPSLFPELLHSRTFAEKILDKKFYIKKYKRELSLLAILTHGVDPPDFGKDTLVTMALAELAEILDFEQDPRSSTSIIKVTAPEPVFAKELADVVLIELEDLNRYYKSLAVSEKTSFIENRIASVEVELESSEQSLINFNRQNRQVSSPALELELEHLTQNVEVQRGIYLTLKQQLELSKIEEVQETSIVSVLDYPEIPLVPSNKKLVRSVLLSLFLGLGFGIFLGFMRSYMFNSGIDERRKLRRVRNFLKKKGKEVIIDRRISGIVSILLLFGLPYYLGHKSTNPVFFGMYSPKFMFVNTVYVLTLIFSVSIFIYISRKKS